MDKNGYLRCKKAISELEPGDLVEVKEGYGIPAGCYEVAGNTEALEPVGYPGGPRSDLFVPLRVNGEIKKLHYIAIELPPEE